MNSLQKLEQTKQKSYAAPYQAYRRRVVQAGIHFNAEPRTIDDWVIE